MNRNNLDRSMSPYLRQHAANPIWWQEWSREVVEQAARQDKPLFVSIGYAACHWCHVMAADAFSHLPTAEFLNRHFICVKIDREQRPDIDQFVMQFILAQTGSGGWPLNAFLTPRLAPIFAFTYCPSEGSDRMPSLLQIARTIHARYADHADSIPDFSPGPQIPAVAAAADLLATLVPMHDPLSGGFGMGQKFPPHATLLFLLYHLCVRPDPQARRVCISTLDAMRLRGLHDHLQGGIFRYCVDRDWTIPHFEKMLYDQAMALWCYSLASRVLAIPAYKLMAVNIVRCLEESFEKDGLFISAHDADTDHKEGATYLWRLEELARLLTPDDLAAFSQTYRDISPAGNFEGAIHLVRQTDAPLEEIEAKLLAVRRTRPQPHADDKILCGINALTAVAFLQAARLLGRSDWEQKAAEIVRRLYSVFWDGCSLVHSIYDGRLEKQSFLFDTAALLLAVTLLHENDLSWHDPMLRLAAYLETFRDADGWMESRADDFHAVHASWFDHPTPSSSALAEMAITRVDILTGKPINPVPFRRPFEADFYNINVLMRNGLFHLITTQNPIDWTRLPPNAIQTRGDHYTDCYNGTCTDCPPNPVPATDS
jgi:uncharacterized protein